MEVLFGNPACVVRQTVRRSGRETTQSNREHLAYWATGLEPTYFEGAFSRAS